MPHVQVNLVSELDYSVVALGIHITWLKVVIKQTFGAELVDVFLDIFFKEFVKDSELEHLFFECQTASDNSHNCEEALGVFIRPLYQLLNHF